MIRFATTDTRTLTLSDGETLIVKARLTHGEVQEMFARMYTVREGQAVVSPQSTDALVVAYLVDWSAKDEQGRPASLRGLSAGRGAGSAQRARARLVPRDSRRDQAARNGDARGSRGAKKNGWWRERVSTDLAICRLMHWTYPDVLALPGDVYDVLVEDLLRAQPR